MPIPEVHACWPPKYVYGIVDLSVDHECGGEKTKILSSFMDWLRYEPNKANRIPNYAPNCQYRRYMHVGHLSMGMTCLM